MTSGEYKLIDSLKFARYKKRSLETIQKVGGGIVLNIF